MAWLYVKGLEDWNSDSTLPWESDITLNVVSNGTPTPRAASWPGWRTRDWVRMLSGTISQPSMAERGAALIASRLDSRANRFPSPADDLAQLMSGIYGPMFAALSESAAHRSSSWKMYRDSQQLELFTTEVKSQATSTRWTLPRNLRKHQKSVGTLRVTENGYTGDFSTNTEYPHCSMSAANWKQWVIELNQESSRRRASARRTFASGCSSSRWPTAVANDDNKSPAAHLSMKRRMKGGPRNEITSLAVASKAWPTPRVEDSESCGNHPGATDSLTGATKQWQTPGSDSFRCRGGDRKDEMGLDQQARMFPTPKSRDYRSGSGDAGLRRNDPDLNVIAENLDTARPDPATAKPGPTCSECGRTLRRRLNPAFVEWLMGWPIGLTACDASETESIQSWRRRLSSYWPRVLELG